jgi:GNAT superfamily N-acetyltransferase
MCEAIRIEPFRSENQNDAKELILAGLQEHWGSIDPTRNPDLRDIGASYRSGIFLVAWMGQRLVGTGAFVPSGAHTCEIKRMSIAREMRRQGLGRLMLHTLIERARAESFQHITLETTATWHEAIAFYLRNGFRITHYQSGDTSTLQQWVWR